jgi:hypothetical protein
MSSPFKTRPPGIVLTGIKAILASGAIAGAIGIWTLLSNQAVEGSYTTDINSDAGTDENNTVGSVPTLVSLIQLDGDLLVSANPTELPDLRSISALPTATVSIQAPIVQTVNLGAGSGGAQSGGNAKKTSRKKSAAKTRSS